LGPVAHVKVSNSTEGEGTRAGFSDFASEVADREMTMGHLVWTTCGILLYLYITQMKGTWNTEGTDEIVIG
jgi:hypothetical protein